MPVEAMLTDDFDPDYTSPDGPVAGKYHAIVVRIDEDGGKGGEMVVDFEVITGTVKGQEGKVQREYFQKTAKAMGRIHTFAMACGLVTAEQLKEMKARGQYPTYDFAGQCIDKHVHLDLQNDEYNGNIRVKAGFGIYAITEKRCKDWPKNTAMLTKAGITTAPSATPMAQQPAPVPGQPQPQQQSATAPSPVDDLLNGVV